MSVWRKCVATVVGSAALGLAVPAQEMPGMDGSRYTAAFSRIFGKSKAFSVTVTVEARDGSSRKPIKFSMPMAFLEGQTRSEMDLTKMSGAGNQEAMQQVVAMGMGKIVTIYQPARNVTLVVMPGAKAYCENSVPAAAAAEQGKEAEVEELGKETVDGHPCVKQRLKTQAAASQTVWWAATDMDNMPVKAEVKEGANQAVMHFADYNFAKPDAAQFAVPEGYKKYNSMMELMMSGMQNLMPAAGK